MRAGPVRLRPATPDDAERLWRWRNDPDTRRASWNEQAVPRAQHERWLADILARPDRKLYVALADGAEVGTVRLDLAEDQAEVSITVAPECRGGGLAAEMLLALAEEAFSALALDRLVARVKGSNPASRAAFERAGYHVTADGPVATLVRERPGGNIA